MFFGKCHRILYKNPFLLSSGNEGFLLEILALNVHYFIIFDLSCEIGELEKARRLFADESAGFRIVRGDNSLKVAQKRLDLLGAGF